jgi:SWI/SNF-related matrix-associated actin-dependent regulator of chromatin subfamily A member 5
MISDDIDVITQRGKKRMQGLNSKYEGLNSDNLNNFKSDVSVQQWEGEDFLPGVSFPPFLVLPTCMFTTTFFFF